MKGDVTEKNVSVEEMEIPEIGGLQALDITTKQPRTFMVKSFDVLNTEWGKRVDFVVVDDFQEWILSSWRISSKRRMKPEDLIGKTIKVTPINDKKCLVEIL